MDLMDIDFLTLKLRERLKHPLPGWESQQKMANVPRVLKDGKFKTDDSTKEGGVLILLYENKGIPHIVFMQRTEYEGVHSGQISFPGGGREDTDHSIEETALREAKEELAIEPAEVDIIGKLSDLYIPPSNFLVTPVIAAAKKEPRFIPEPAEVARIIELGLEDLLDEENLKYETITISSQLSMKVRCYCLDGLVIWGATAMILTEFLDILREPGPKS